MIIMTLIEKPLTKYTVDLGFVQIRDLVLQMPDDEKKLIYNLLKSEFENKGTEWISEEFINEAPEEEVEVSDEEFYESLKTI